MTLLSILVGIGGGVGAVLFHWLIRGFTLLLFGTASAATFLEGVTSFPWYYRIAIPAFGGLLVGLILTHKVVNEAHGDGVPEVMEAVALKRGNIRPWIAPVKALVSAISIGSGGAGGREGPIIQIGSALGSTVGQVMKLDPERTKTLLAAGAAAGIAGAFNAPLAGIVFSWEILLRKMSPARLWLIIAAAVTGKIVANIIIGLPRPLFDIPGGLSMHYTAIPLYVGLGIVAAGIALLFTNSLYWFEGMFERMRVLEMLKPALGGLLLGVLALVVPQVHEPSAFLVMTDTLYATLPVAVVIGLLFAKIVAVSLTLGSGGSGGIFAPSLFIGAMAGSAYGKIMAGVLPGIADNSSLYAVIGMAAVFAGATHAPLTAIVILFELTGAVPLIIPLIIVCSVSVFIAKRLQRKSIYTGELVKRGVDIKAQHLP